MLCTAHVESNVQMLYHERNHVYISMTNFHSHQEIFRTIIMDLNIKETYFTCTRQKAPVKTLKASVMTRFFSFFLFVFQTLGQLTTQAIPPKI